MYDTADEIDLSRYKISADELTDIVNKVANENIFSWHIAGMPYYYNTDENKLVTSVRLGYVSDIPEKQNTIENAIDDIAALTEDFTNPRKVDIVKFYFMQNFRYDNRSEGYCNDVYSLFTTGLGRCSSLSLGFKAVMDRLDIPCRVVANKKINHTYNEVYINDTWKRIDLTALVFKYLTFHRKE